MTAQYAFQFTDLTVLLGLELGRPADQADIDTINEILERRRSTTSAACEGQQGRGRRRTPLHLVPNPTS